MAKPSREIVDPQTTCYYHVVSRCVRRVFLLSKGDYRRKRYIYQRLKLLDQVFAVDVCGFSLMESHFHMVLRLDPQQAQS